MRPHLAVIMLSLLASGSTLASETTNSNAPSFSLLAKLYTIFKPGSTSISPQNTSNNVLAAGQAFARQTLPPNAVYSVVDSLTQAAQAAQNPAQQYIIISDGLNHLAFKKNHVAGALKYTWAGQVWGADFKDYVPIIAFTNGNSGDVTAAFQAAVPLAAKFRLGISFPPNASYTINNNVFINNGVKFLRGNGTVLTATNMPPLTNIFRLVRGASNIDISGFTLDLNYLPRVDGILASNPQNLTIHHMHFVNVASRAINIYSSTGTIQNVNIQNNTIRAIAGSRANKGIAMGIAVSNGMDIPAQYKGSHNPIWLQYVKEGTVAPNPYPASGINIRYNQIDGGYYAISFGGITNSNISHNVTTNNVRNISLQSNSSNNTITHNYLNNSTSSSIHIAYNSNNNTVSNNTIVSERAGGQGLLQAYQSSHNNTFNHNSVEVLSKPGPSWVLYAATNSNDTTFTNNLIDSPMNRSLIGVEAIWDSQTAKGEPSAYMQSALNDPYASSSPITYNGGKGSLNNIRIENNIFLPNSANRPLLYIGAGRSGGFSGKEHIVANVTGLTFNNNTIFGNQYSELERLRENGATIKRLKNDYNTVSTRLAGADSNQIVLDREVGNPAAENANNQSRWLYSIRSHTLDNQVQNLRLIGAQAKNGTGNNSNNLIIGNAYDNQLNGGAGNDVLIGGYGSDILTGGAGNDTFVFDAPLNGQVDRITDFDPAADHISLAQTVFGELHGAWFAGQSKAVTASTRVFQKSQRLYYDADGAGSYFDPIPFVELQAALPLQQSHFKLLP